MQPSQCCVPGCRQECQQEPLFPLPREAGRRASWLRAVGLKQPAGAGFGVCARHFHPSVLHRVTEAGPDGALTASVRLSPGAVPSRHLPTVPHGKGSPPPLTPATPAELLLRARALAKATHSLASSTGHHISRGMRNDSSLVPPIRQTASIFKQPVTVYRNHEGKVKADFKHGPQEKPKQLFWEKRLEGLRASDADGNPLERMELPKALKPAISGISDETLLQSVATALHVLNGPITGQAALKPGNEKDPSVFINTDQPLIQAVTITDEDIKQQEERVNQARKKLQEFMKELES